MRTLLQTLFFVLLVTQICFAQWYQQNSGTEFDLVDVDFYNINNGIAISYQYTGNPRCECISLIFSTSNGGTNWETIEDWCSGLYCVTYVDSNYLFTGGVFEIYRSTDGGQNWEVTFIDVNTFIFGICFADYNIGTAVGFTYDGPDSISVILRTTNSGSDWFNQTSPIQAPLRDIFYFDANYGWIVGNNGTILKTTNSGTDWNSQTSGVSENLRSVHFVDQNTGWVAGEAGAILKTTNGGIDWIEIGSGTILDLNRVYFTDTNNGWVVGSEGTILRTINGGIDWTIQTSGTTLGLNSVHFSDANNGTAVGQSGIILKTTNGGVSFVEEEQLSEVPTEFLLSNNYPNPFNPITTIKYSVPQTSQVQIKIFDVLGSEIETLINEEKLAGTYEITWYAEELPSGVYFYQLNTESFIETKKMLLLK